jgi:diphthine synthase
MTLYLIGTGLWDAKDISLKGLEALRMCSKVYLENYTSKLSSTLEQLEAIYGKKIILADRTMVETQSGELFIAPAKNENIALLIIGDVFSATTHISIYMSARKAGVSCEVIPNASIVSGIGILGLEIYKYGKITSIPFHNEKVVSPVEIIKLNQHHGMHTLILFDLDPGKNKFMKVPQAVDYLLMNSMEPETLALACAGIGSPHPEIKSGQLRSLRSFNSSLIPQCMVIPGKLHFVEEEAVAMWK